MSTNTAPVCENHRRLRLLISDQDPTGTEPDTPPFRRQRNATVCHTHRRLLRAIETCAAQNAPAPVDSKPKSISLIPKFGSSHALHCTGSETDAKRVVTAAVLNGQLSKDAVDVSCLSFEQQALIAIHSEYGAVPMSVVARRHDDGSRKFSDAANIWGERNLVLAAAHAMPLKAACKVVRDANLVTAILDATDLEALGVARSPEAALEEMRRSLDQVASKFAADDGYTIETPAELVASAPTIWVVKGVLPDSGIAAVYGPSACGKSFLAFDLAGSVGRGTPWFGYKTRTCPVTILALEGQGGIRQRVMAYQKTHGAMGDVVVIRQSWDIRKDTDSLGSYLKKEGRTSGIVIVDTLNRAAPGADENSSEGMGAVIAGAQRLQSILGGLVILIHHSGKDIGRGLRGHSSLLAALDAAIEVTNDAGKRRWKIAKSKDGGADLEQSFRLEVVEVERDQDADAVTSCVVVPVDSSSSSPLAALTGRKRLVMDAVETSLTDTGMGISELIDAVEPAYPAATKDSRTKQTRTYIKRLVESGHLTSKDGIIYPRVSVREVVSTKAKGSSRGNNVSSSIHGVRKQSRNNKKQPETD